MIVLKIANLKGFEITQCLLMRGFSRAKAD